MRYFIAITALCLALTTICCRGQAQQTSTALLHSQLKAAVDSKATTDSLYNVLSSLHTKTAITQAYIALLTALKAKHAWNPYTKVKELNRYDKLMQQAVAAGPHNIEIRFLRFSVENNVPAWLGFGKDLEADKQEILTQLAKKNYGTADAVLTRAIIVFLLNSKRCTPQQAAALHTYLSVI